MEEIEVKCLYKLAWIRWGADKQIDVLIEEMAELTLALLKTRRNGVVFSHSVKVRHTSQESAHAELYRLTGLHVYWCPVCHFFHIGHTRRCNK